MPNWGQILAEVKDCKRKDAFDFTRRKYIRLLSEKTSRNVICYYSGFLQKPNLLQSGITDDDKNGFMATIHGLERQKGLDLVLHTPGGNLAATESIINYLYKMFDKDIRVIIPQIAMSAGTLIACCSKEIIMGKQSNIGPTDPQTNGFPMYGVLEEFKKAIEETQKDPSQIPMWQTIIGKYHPTFLGECEKSIKWADKILRKSLSYNMFSDDPEKETKVNDIALWLNNHTDSLSHSRHFHIEDAEENGLKIIKLEDDDYLQDLVLTVHHTYMHTLANTPALKIVENQIGNAIVINHNG